MAGGVEGGDAVQQDVQSQQQGGQRQPLGQRAAAHHHADDGTEDQQQGDELFHVVLSFSRIFLLTDMQLKYSMYG